MLALCEWDSPDQRPVMRKAFLCHDDVIKWKHFPRYWPFVWGIHRSPVDSSHKDQCRGALTFSLICAWIHTWRMPSRVVRSKIHSWTWNDRRSVSRPWSAADHQWLRPPTDRNAKSESERYRRTRFPRPILVSGCQGLPVRDIKICVIEYRVLYHTSYWTRGGVAKVPFVNFSASKIFDLTKVHFRFLESHSYLQVSPQLSCGDTCKIWTRYPTAKVCFDNGERLEK